MKNHIQKWENGEKPIARSWNVLNIPIKKSDIQRNNKCIHRINKKIKKTVEDALCDKKNEFASIICDI